MNQQTPRGSSHLPLIGLNAALVAVLAAVTLGPSAPGQSRRGAPGEYGLTSLKVQGFPNEFLVVTDGLSQRLSVVRWNFGERRLEGIGTRDLKEDADRRGGGGRGR